MAAIVVIEEGNFESGARLAGLVARSLEQFEPVRVILRDDGPLQQWLTEHVHGRIEICNRGNFPYDLPLAERVSAAASFLETDPADVVYVFGLGASDFAMAARSQDRRVVLHVYQPAPRIEHLLARDQAKVDCAVFCDALVTAEDFHGGSISRLFGRTPVRVRNVGYRVDFEWLNRVCGESVPDAVNEAGERLNWNGAFVVGGSGVTEEEALFFNAVARECPDVAFAWLGRRFRRENGQEVANEMDAASANFYATEPRRDVWPSLPDLGAYLVCGRQTDLTLALCSTALGKPVIGFNGGGASELLGRYGILCHGMPDPSLARDIVKKLAEAPAAAAGVDMETRRRQLDIEGCVDAILDIVADVRLIEPD